MCCIAGEGRACSAALGEVTVDFCLGPALERDGERGGPDAVWPMFVLWGDGAVYTVLCYTREQCCASVPLTYGSGSGSGSCSFFVSGFQDANKK